VPSNRYWIRSNKPRRCSCCRQKHTRNNRQFTSAVSLLKHHGWSVTPLLTTVSCSTLRQRHPVAVFSLCSWTRYPRIGEALDLANFKTKKVDIDARRASLKQEIARLDVQQRPLEQAKDQVSRLAHTSLPDQVRHRRSFRGPPAANSAPIW